MPLSQIKASMGIGQSELDRLESILLKFEKY